MKYYLCQQCAGDDISCDFSCTWDPKADEWDVGDCTGEDWCCDCDDNTSCDFYEGLNLKEAQAKCREDNDIDSDDEDSEDSEDSDDEERCSMDGNIGLNCDSTFFVFHEEDKLLSLAELVAKYPETPHYEATEGCACAFCTRQRDGERALFLTNLLRNAPTTTGIE